MEAHSHTTFDLTSKLQIEAAYNFSYTLHGWEQEGKTIQDEMLVEDMKIIFDDCFCIGDYLGGFDEDQVPVVEAFAIHLAKQVPNADFTGSSSYWDGGGTQKAVDISYKNGDLLFGEKNDGYWHISNDTKVMFDDPKNYHYLFTGNEVFDKLVSLVKRVESMDDGPSVFVCDNPDRDTTLMASEKGIEVMVEEDFIKSVGNAEELVEAGLDEDEVYEWIFELDLDYKPYVYRRITVK